MRSLARVIVVVAGVLAAACVPETDSFLSEPGEQPVDERLNGFWYSLNRSGTIQITLSIQYDDDNNKLSITWLQLMPSQPISKTEKPVAWLRYVGHTTKLDGQRYINLSLRHAEWPHEVPKRMIMRYWIDQDGGLRMALMDERRVKKAIEAGELKGSLPKKGFPRITSDRKMLIAYIKRMTPDKAFRRWSKPMRRLSKTDK